MNMKKNGKGHMADHKVNINKTMNKYDVGKNVNTS